MTSLWTSQQTPWQSLDRGPKRHIESYFHSALLVLQGFASEHFIPDTENFSGAAVSYVSGTPGCGIPLLREQFNIPSQQESCMQNSAVGADCSVYGPQFEFVADTGFKSFLGAFPRRSVSPKAFSWGHEEAYPLMLWHWRLKICKGNTLNEQQTKPTCE